jgi:hypothetical protein
MISIQEPCLEIFGRSKSNNPGARKVVGRQLGTPYSFGLDIERSQSQKDDRTQDPAPNESEGGSKQSIEPLDMRKLDELLYDPDNESTDKQRSQKNKNEAQE